VWAGRVPQRRYGLGILYELRKRLVDSIIASSCGAISTLKTVERIIGYKPGTGGTAGVSYLAKALRLRPVPELWEAADSM